MIEIIHFTNQRGKPMVGVINPDANQDFWTVKRYKNTYAAGLRKPHYPLPAPIKDGPVSFPVAYVSELIRDFFQTWGRT